MTKSVKYLLSSLLAVMVIFLASFASSGIAASTHDVILQDIQGRNDLVESPPYTRVPIYHAKIPPNWIRKNPSQNESLADTTKPLCEFMIPGEGDQYVRITIHNFPSEQVADRIPPEAQITRWKRQFAFLEPTSISVIPQSYSGFAGFLFEGTGSPNADASTVTMMAWAMQLAPFHYSSLSLLINKSDDPTESRCLKQMRSDITIKATGPVFLMAKHRRDIISFARSLELIQEIP